MRFHIPIHQINKDQLCFLTNDLLFGFVDIYGLARGNFDQFRDQNIQWLIKMKEKLTSPNSIFNFCYFFIFSPSKWLVKSFNFRCAKKCKCHKSNRYVFKRKIIELFHFYALEKLHCFILLRDKVQWNSI